jgi:hypothetical protein
VGVAVHKSWHHHAPGGIHLFGAAGFREVLDPAGWAHRQQNAIANQQGSVGDQADFVQRRPASRSMGTAQGQQLPGAANQSRSRCEPFITVTSM